MKTDLTIKPKTIPNLPRNLSNPIFAGLPAYLKDPANYEKVQKTVLNALSSGHSHGEVIEWATCIQCQRRFRERGQVLKKLGFRNPAQYMAWKKVHDTIKHRDPLPKYNTKLST